MLVHPAQRLEGTTKSAPRAALTTAAASGAQRVSAGIFGVAPPVPADPAPGEISRAAMTDLCRGLVEMTPELFGRALRLSRSPAAAEDLVQDTVERAIRFASHYQPGTNLRAWVYQILFSVFITRCRRLRRERNALGILATDPCAWTIPDAGVVELSGLSPGVMRALGTLPRSFREAVVLVDLEELSYKDAAAQLGVPVGTVMSRLHRGRKLLAEVLRGEAGEAVSEAPAEAA